MTQTKSRCGLASVLIALSLAATSAVAQNDLGALLDNGARQLSAGEFKDEIVQTMVAGRNASGGNVEVMYAASGVIQGVGTHPLFTGLPFGKIYGEWAIDDAGRICTVNTRIGKVSLPDRCQFWFKFGGTYFVSDSDTNRGALVLMRTVKQ